MMTIRSAAARTETQKKRSLMQRMVIVHAFFGLLLLLVVSRLIELQIVRGAEYREVAQSQHYGGVRLPAKRGEILSVDSKTNERHILATNTTQDLVYVDPLITAHPTEVAETLADILLTESTHKLCTQGSTDCPREFIPFYAPAFDPVTQYNLLHSGALLEPLPPGGILPPTILKLPDLVEARRLFARDIEDRISSKRVTFAPLKYGATKTELEEVAELDIPGIIVMPETGLIYANPEEVSQTSIPSIAQRVGEILQIDKGKISDLLISRPLRYVPILRRVPPALSLQIKELQLKNYKEALEKSRLEREQSRNAVQDLDYNLRSVALIAEHWRFYPDSTIASHLVGFLNATQEAQYGIERAFNTQLRGQEGLISTVSDPMGGQILTGEQKVIEAKDGDTIVLTIDRAVQKEVETILDRAVQRYGADSGQVIIMDPFTGRIIAMANAPVFDSNNYAIVYEKEPTIINDENLPKIVVELFDPETNARVVKAYKDDLFTAQGREKLSEKTQEAIADIEKQYDLKKYVRYYFYEGQDLRIEIFPTDKPNLWLKFKNDIGVGAYLNRTMQEIYEPGSVLKPIVMAIALDQGELRPTDEYNDVGPVEVDEYKINNNDFKHYGRVNMINCLEFSINTCMTSISQKLGPKLLSRALEHFGFGKITGIELEDELPGEIRPWREWSQSLLATTSFGQGLSTTPLQVIAGWGALANGGKLMKPHIIDTIIHPDGTEERTVPSVLDQPITRETSETITAMLVSAVENGFANKGKVKGYRIAGKTGTSQIAGPGGRYLAGTGSTFATFAGYAPAQQPKFLMLVKLDRPRSSTHGATAAAPLFQEIATFLFKYWGIPPDQR